jgi:tRNA-dihydrouridine synthase C
MGPHGIDLNFGCPAKVVNRHGGGAALLQDPELLTRIVAAVRRAVPAHIPVSAKMRLGFDDGSRAVECAQAIALGGANELVVHARTKADAYRPPAYWERVNDIRLALSIPVAANGEIWNADDARRCREASGCHMIMLGRGIVVDPGLALAIRRSEGQPENGLSPEPEVSWESLLPLMGVFWILVCSRLERKQQAGRLKQWLNFLRRRYVQAEVAFLELRTVSDPAVVGHWMLRNGVLAAHQIPVARRNSAPDTD